MSVQEIRRYLALAKRAAVPGGDLLPIIRDMLGASEAFNTAFGENSRHFLADGSLFEPHLRLWRSAMGRAIGSIASRYSIDVPSTLEDLVPGVNDG